MLACKKVSTLKHEKLLSNDFLLQFCVRFFELKNNREIKFQHPFTLQASIVLIVVRILSITSSMKFIPQHIKTKIVDYLKEGLSCRDVVKRMLSGKIENAVIAAHELSEITRQTVHPEDVRRVLRKAGLKSIK